MAPPPPPPPPPWVPLHAASVGAYMDSQENALRHDLHGVRIARIADELIVILPADKLFEDDALSDDGRATLEKIANILQRYAHSSIAVTGHTDTFGKPDANLLRSRHWAALAGDLLKQDGVAPARLQVQGLGDAHLRIATPANVSEPRNRRIEIRIVPVPG